MTPWSGRRLHFVGMGGAGMSGLALVAKELGAEVSGSDRAESSYSERLRAAGIETAIGHDAANVPDGAELVVSTAIPATNPERERAHELGLKLLHRADLLAEATALKKSIAVSGAHGKTTTTGMLVHILRETGRDPAFLIGGELRALGTNAAWGSGDWIVVEADESDRSFLKLSPDVAVITNIELDHHTTYASEDELIAAFDQFAGQSGQVIRAEELEREELQLQVPGEHNVTNALAAVAAAEAAGVPHDDAVRAVATFSGTGRRFEARGRTSGGARVFDDYAHHPTEVRATLEAARTLDAERVVAVFQPHLYSRTQHLARQFGEALALADAAMVVDIYPARETAADFPGVTGYLVAAAAANAAHGRSVWWIPSMEQAAAVLDAQLREGDVLLTMGAGNVDTLAARLTA